MAPKRLFARGGSVPLRRSLRVRVVTATAVSFLGLGALVCLVLPRAYQEQAREGLRERTRILARSAAFLLQQKDGADASAGFGGVAGFLDGEPDFEAAALFDADGNILEEWPEPSSGWEVAPSTGEVVEASPFFLAFVPVSGRDGVAALGVRISTAGLAQDLANVRWLFSSIFLFACALFWGLASYLTRGVLDPLEEIRKAAMSLADGEPIVKIPRSGDREIDELGSYIAALGEKRRNSAVMPQPRSPARTAASAPPPREDPGDPVERAGATALPDVTGPGKES